MQNAKASSRGRSAFGRKIQNEKEKFKENFIKRLINFSVKIINFSDDFASKRRLWSIRDQLIRSATSIGANVLEAKGSSSKKDYIRFFEIALKSANETKYWLLLVKELDRGYSTHPETLLKELEEIAKIIGASILTLKGKR